MNRWMDGWIIGKEEGERGCISRDLSSFSPFVVVDDYERSRTVAVGVPS